MSDVLNSDRVSNVERPRSAIAARELAYAAQSRETYATYPDLPSGQASKERAYARVADARKALDPATPHEVKHLLKEEQAVYEEAKRRAEYSLNSERFSNDYQSRSGAVAEHLDHAAAHRREAAQTPATGAGIDEKSMARAWLGASHRINDGSERTELKTVVEERRQSWAEGYRARRSDAGQQVAEARTELQAVKSERRGHSL